MQNDKQIQRLDGRSKAIRDIRAEIAELKALIKQQQLPHHSNEFDKLRKEFEVFQEKVDAIYTYGKRRGWFTT